MYFPLYVDLSEKEILVAGAGQVAARRIRVLMHFGGYITVVAPEISDEIRDLKAEADASKEQALSFIAIAERCFDEKDLNRKDLVIAATADRKLNERIAVLCRKRGIPINDASDRSLCDFQFPSVVARDPLVIGVNASGENHALVKKTRQKIEQMLTKESFYET